MAAETEEAALDELLADANTAGSIDNTIKVFADETKLDPNKTSGRKHRALLKEVITRMKAWVVALLAGKADLGADGKVLPEQLPAASSYTDEQAQDAAAALFTGGTHSGISFAYDDETGKVNATVETSASGAAGIKIVSYGNSDTGVLTNMVAAKLLNSSNKPRICGVWGTSLFWYDFEPTGGWLRATTTGSILASSSLGYDSGRNEVWACSGTSGGLVVANATTAAVSFSGAVSGFDAYEKASCLYIAATDRMYFFGVNKATLSVFNGGTKAIVETITAPTLIADVHFCATYNVLFIGHTNGRYSVYDLASGTFLVSNSTNQQNGFTPGRIVRVSDTVVYFNGTEYTLTSASAQTGVKKTASSHCPQGGLRIGDKLFLLHHGGSVIVTDLSYKALDGAQGLATPRLSYVTMVDFTQELGGIFYDNAGNAIAKILI